MSFSYCTEEDMKIIEVGQQLKINARYEDLKRPNGEFFQFVVRKDDVIVVVSNDTSSLQVRFYEDMVSLKSKKREEYGLFVVEPKHIQKFN